MNYLLIFVGGGFGSLLRYSVTEISRTLMPSFPLGTLLANGLSCVLLGFVTVLFARGTLSDQQRLLLITGICGGFSTYSTFTNDTYLIYSAGYWMLALGNIVLNFIVCITCLLLGHKIAGLI